MSRRPPAMFTVVGSAESPAPPPPKLFQDYLDLAAVLATSPPDLDFVIPGMLAGTIGVLVSPGGVGKSMLALAVAVSVAAGRDGWQIFGEDPKSGPVLVVSAEDPGEILARRLHSLRASWLGMFDDSETLTRLRIKSTHGTGFSFGSWDGQSFMMSGALEVLSLEIEQLRPRLVIIDTLNRCLAGISENDNAAMGRVISELEAIIAPTKAACLVLHHTSKATALQGMGDQQQAARGASAITDNARFQLNLVGMSAADAEARGLDNEQRRRWVRLIATKANYAPPLPERWLRRDAGGVLAGGSEPLPAVRAAKGKRRTGEPSDDQIAW